MIVCQIFILFYPFDTIIRIRSFITFLLFLGGLVSLEHVIRVRALLLYFMVFYYIIFCFFKNYLLLLTWVWSKSSFNYKTTTVCYIFLPDPSFLKRPPPSSFLIVVTISGAGHVAAGHHLWPSSSPRHQLRCHPPSSLPLLTTESTRANALCWILLATVVATGRASLPLTTLNLPPLSSFTLYNWIHPVRMTKDATFFLASPGLLKCCGLDHHWLTVVATGQSLSSRDPSPSTLGQT